MSAEVLAVRDLLSTGKPRASPEASPAAGYAAGPPAPAAALA
jgi:hypothetical protein